MLEQKLDDATEKGKAEGKIEMAGNLLKAGVSIEVIAKSADLTVDEVKQLVEN